MTDNATLSRRDRNLADIRDRATLIAERIVLDQGVGALSARGLAKELGVSVGSLYNAFGDLDGVVRAVNATCAKMLLTSLQLAVEGAAPERRSRIAALGEAYFDFAVAEPHRWRLLFERRSDVAPDRKTEELEARFLEMLFRAGDADPASEDQRQFFLLLWASVHGLASLASRPTITSINPTRARTHVRDLIETSFNTFPAP